MFGFFSKKSDFSIDFSEIAVDFHNHLIPSVDDGVESPDETISILTEMKELGYQKIYISPHIMGEKYTNTKQGLLEAVRTLNKDERIQTLDLDIDVIAEYLLDESFEDKLLANDFLTLPGRYILVETSMNFDFPFVRDYIYELIKKGYKPILAHPERYRYIYNEPNFMDRYESMLDWGIEFQLNLFALSSIFGDQARKTAEQLIEANFYSYVCTDIHKYFQCKHFTEVKHSSSLKKLLQSETIQNKRFL